MSKIHRYEVPVDDQWHEFPELNGDIIHIAARQPTIVEFWAEHYQPDEVVLPQLAETVRRFRVYGTGHDLPPQPRLIHGTAVAGHLVWHLVEEGDWMGEPDP